MHWQYKRFNYGYDRFYKMLEKYPRTIFIGHAQTFGRISTKITRTTHRTFIQRARSHRADDRPLPPGLFRISMAIFSAGSGLNAFKRDEEHGRNFFVQHQDN